MVGLARCGRFGKGNWKDILEAYEFRNNRSTVDCKDKWRNLEKYAPPPASTQTHTHTHTHTHSHTHTHTHTPPPHTHTHTHRQP